MICPTTPTGSRTRVGEKLRTQGDVRPMIGIGVALDLVAQPACNERGRRPARCPPPGDRQRLAVVERLERGQLVRVLLDQIADAMDHLAALGRRHPPPVRALVVKAATSRRHRELNVLGRAVRHRPETLFSRRIERLKRLPARRLDPFAIDQQTTRLTNELLDVLSQPLRKARKGLRLSPRRWWRGSVWKSTCWLLTVAFVGDRGAITTSLPPSKTRRVSNPRKGSKWAAVNRVG